jgi:hypothetical protein
MIWHIFKKDSLLLWPLVLIVAFVHVVSASLWIRLGQFNEPRELMLTAHLLPLLGLLGIVILTIAVLHQDALPGVRQDWLMRPVNRRHLLLAKLLFVLVMVQGPLLAAQVTEALVQGFPLLSALDAASANGVTVMCLFVLPAMVLGAVTQTMTEAILGGVAVVIGMAMVMLLLGTLGALPSPTAGSGLIWMVLTVWASLAAVGSALILTLQFARRHTRQSRYLAVGAAVLALFAVFIPWKPLFAIQQWLAPNRGAGQPVTVAFDPSAEKTHSTLEANAPIAYLPLRVSGLPAHSILYADRADIQISDLSGTILYRGTSHLSIDGKGSMRDAHLEVRKDEHAEEMAETSQKIFLPAKIYAAVMNRPIRLAVNYSLTLFGLASTDSIAATDGDRRVKNIGRCATKVDDDGDAVVVSCLSTGEALLCFTAYLEHVPSGRRNPANHVCRPRYSPHAAGGWPDVLSHFARELAFLDRSGLTKYPVDRSQLAQSRVVIESYQAQDHFTRRLVIPSVRLSDLSSAPTGG